MWERDLKFHLELHKSGKCHILDDNRYTLARNTFADTDFEDDFAVHASAKIEIGQVKFAVLTGSPCS